MGLQGNLVTLGRKVKWGIEVSAGGFKNCHLLHLAWARDDFRAPYLGDS